MLACKRTQKLQNWILSIEKKLFQKPNLSHKSKLDKKRNKKRI